MSPQAALEPVTSSPSAAAYAAFDASTFEGFDCLGSEGTGLLLPFSPLSMSNPQLSPIPVAFTPEPLVAGLHASLPLQRASTPSSPALPAAASGLEPVSAVQTSTQSALATANEPVPAVEIGRTPTPPGTAGPAWTRPLIAPKLTGTLRYASPLIVGLPLPAPSHPALSTYCAYPSARPTSAQGSLGPSPFGTYDSVSCVQGRGASPHLPATAEIRGGRAEPQPDAARYWPELSSPSLCRSICV